jgi:translation initiation factor IF-3
VPVPRRFDRRPPERDQTRINDRIRVPEVRLVGEDGKQIGVVKTTEALSYAQERDLDLVEVAADARPPVCRVLDYSKYKYEQEQKQKAARKHQQQINVREIKFRPKIAQNDYDTKKGHVRRFLLGRDRVKITIMFRGREVTHPERGMSLLQKLAVELAEVALVEQAPIQDGRNMTMMLAPSKSILGGDGKDKPEDGKEQPDEGKAPLDEGKATPDEGKAPSDEGKAPSDEGKEQSDGATPAPPAPNGGPAADSERTPAASDATA